MPKTLLALLKQVLYNKASLLGITPEKIVAFCKQHGLTSFNKEAFTLINDKLTRTTGESNGQ